METIIASLISIAGTLLVALIALGPKLKALEKQIEVEWQSLGKLVEVHDKDSVGRKGELSREHDGLAKELSGVQMDITFLKDGRIADEARRESLKSQVLDTQKAMDVLNASLTHMAELEDKLTKAKMEIAVLQKENASLQEELKQSLDRAEEELEP